MSALQPLVSAIISSYNSEKFIKGKVEDLLLQTISERLEIIIIISGSEQQEEKIVNEYYKKYENIKLIVTDKRESIYTAWNKGIKMSNGKYITNSNTDDRLREDAFEVMVDYLEKNSAVGLVYANQYYSFIENETFKELSNKIKYPKPDYKYLLLLERCIIGSQPMWRREIHLKEGIWFDEKYEIAGDYDFELRVAEKYQIKHLPLYLGVYYKSPNKTNKEYENSVNTFQETVEIMANHLKKFIDRSKSKDIARYYFIFSLIYSIPHKIYKIFYDIIKKYFPRREIHSLQFRVWFLSYILEKQSKYECAVNLCLDFLKKHNSELIRERLKQLK